VVDFVKNFCPFFFIFSVSHSHPKKKGGETGDRPLDSFMTAIFSGNT
jgi:hypothetical protein